MLQRRTNSESVPVLSGPVLSRSTAVGCTTEAWEVFDWASDVLKRDKKIAKRDAA